MNSKQLLTLGAVTFVVIIAAGLAVYLRSSDSGAAAAGLLAPGFADRLNQVSELRITTKDGTFSMTRGDGGQWTMPEKAGYPVMFEKVKELIVKTASAKRVEPKTARPENYGRIGVREPGSEDAKGKLVEFQDSGGATILAMIFGDTKYRAGGSDPRTYTRAPDQAQAWLVDGLPRLESDAMRWLVGDVVDVGRGRVRSARVSHADGEVLEVSRASPREIDFTVANLPEGAELRSATAANGLASALANVTFEDVKLASDLDFSAASETVYETFDGLRITARTLKLDDDYWVKFDAEYDETLIAEPGDGQAVVIPDAPEDGAREAAEIAERVAGWAYKIPSYKGSDVAGRLKDILKEPEPEPGPGDPSDG